MTGHAPDYAMLMVRKQVLFVIQYFISDLGWCQCWCYWYDKRTFGKEIKIRKISAWADPEYSAVIIGAIRKIPDGSPVEIAVAALE